LTQAPEVPDDVSLINVALNQLITFESISTIEPDSFYALNLSRITEVTSIVERPEDVTNLSSVSFSDVVDASSVELTQAPEVPDDVSLINVALNQLTTFESVSIVETIDPVPLGNTLGRSQEITKIPEDIITNKVDLGESTVEISSEINTDARTYGAISTEIDIDTIIDNGAIDQFNELIDPADIDTNP
jgi:hypothetical protein